MHSIGACPTSGHATATIFSFEVMDGLANREIRCRTIASSSERSERQVDVQCAELDGSAPKFVLDEWVPITTELKFPVGSVGWTMEYISRRSGQAAPLQGIL